MARSRKVREASLAHAKIKAEFANVIETEKFANAEVMETTWQDSKSKAESIVNVKFKKGSGIQIPVTTYLKNFEQKILANRTTGLELRGDSAWQVLPGYSIREPHLRWRRAFGHFGGDRSILRQYRSEVQQGVVSVKDTLFYPQSR